MSYLRPLLAPALLGIAVLLLWEAACRLIPIPAVLLPPPWKAYQQCLWLWSPPTAATPIA